MDESSAPTKRQAVVVMLLALTLSLVLLMGLLVLAVAMDKGVFGYVLALLATIPVGVAIKGVVRVTRL